MMIKKVILFCCLSFVFIVALASAKASMTDGLQIINLRCEALENPSAVDAIYPRLSWAALSKERNVQQVAYQILVASSLKKLSNNDGDLWDSKKTLSSNSIQIAYEGKSLLSRQSCYWKVRIWTNKGGVAWSSAASWSMGLLNRTDWQAKWIGWDKPFPWDSVTKFSRLSARYFRKEFSVEKKIVSATAYISGLGLYVLYINGQKIGKQVLAPSPTDYSKEAKYNTFDVTKALNNGENALGIILGNGRFFTMRQNYKPWKWHNFGFPKLLFQLEIKYEDGSIKKIISDDTWKMTANGPIRSNNEYDGEDYDATKEMVGWKLPGFNEANWFNAKNVLPPDGILSAQMNNNMQVMDSVKVKSIHKIGPKDYIMDFGQNMAGWVRLNVNGSKHRGDTLTVRYAESLQPDGQLYVENLRDAKSTDHYILKGDQGELFAPQFVYHGFRYIEVRNYPGTPSKENFLAQVVYDKMQTTGSFTCSDTTINQIFKNAYWTIRSDYKGMPVDCPQRNERQPWLGDRATGAYGESFLFNNANLYAKWLNDIQDAQKENGSIPDVAPTFWYYFKDDITWPSTYLYVANMLYHQFGDKQTIVKHYASMKKWIDYMQQQYMQDYLFKNDSYGDWCVPPELPTIIHSKAPKKITDGGLLATATFYNDLKLMEKFASIADRTNDSSCFAALALKIKNAFNKKYFNRQEDYYSNNSITSNLLPLTFGMVNEGYKQKVFENIVDKTLTEDKGHIGTGVIGTQFLMRGFTDYGRPDIAYKLASNRTYPSWGYMAASGATTIWELWNGNTASPKMNSQNHVMLLGDLLIWLFEDQAGIKSDPNDIAFKKIIMHPRIDTKMQFVNASYHSPYGEIRSDWRKEGHLFIWNISIPTNTSAEVYIPYANNGTIIEEGNEDLAHLKDGHFLRKEKGYMVYNLGSGTYHFKSTFQ
ncbi:family 78 glycoside hydrolase catalytic domain [Arachidicoccus sp.]|uniref:alpha-L-rhamnosidase n=1 Tax=Arachidicoccus sp. TaxID=1872624 RepID=UPI003D1CFB28